MKLIVMGQQAFGKDCLEKLFASCAACLARGLG